MADITIVCGERITLSLATEATVQFKSGSNELSGPEMMLTTVQPGRSLHSFSLVHGEVDRIQSRGYKRYERFQRVTQFRVPTTTRGG